MIRKRIGKCLEERSLKLHGRVKVLAKALSNYHLKDHTFYKELISVINNQEKRITQLEQLLNEKN